MKIDVRKIECLMADGGIRQKDIAARTGTPYQSLSAVMRRGTCLPVLDRLAARYESYAAQFAQALHCSVDAVAPYVYFAITTVTDYMIFGEAAYIAPQIELIKTALRGFLEAGGV